jgi:2-polyprenyl-6-hydroxyphenyl methylase / 3-demethylubiquinone-9 3-methyltransferase
MRNDLTIYDRVADRWWSDEVRWVRTLKNLVPGRLAWFDRHIDWRARTCSTSAARAASWPRRWPRAARRSPASTPPRRPWRPRAGMPRATGLSIRYDTGVGEALPYGDAAFDAVVCVDVLEHVADLPACCPRWPASCAPAACSSTTRSTATRSRARDHHHGRGHPAPPAARHARPGPVHQARRACDARWRGGSGAGPDHGLGPRGMNRRGDLTFGPLPLTAILYMGIARKPESGAC